MGTSILGEIIEIMISGLVSMGQGMANGIGETLQALFVTQTGSGDSIAYHLSTTGQIIVAFGALALAFSVCRLCVGFIFGLGKGRL